MLATQSRPLFGRYLPVLALFSGTLVWGTIWYPYRILAELGLGALTASLLTYLVALLLALGLFGRELRVRPDRELVILAIAAGITNVGFIWATNHGVILRVLLLFYLMPVWTVFFAWLLLGLVPGLRTALLLVLASSGALVMLYQPATGLPLPRSGAEWMALLAGVCFALSNVLVHKTSGYTARCKSLWIIGGCVVIGGLSSALLEPRVNAAPAALSLWLILILGVVLLCVNLGVQYGLERFPPTRVPLIYLFELVVASLASWLLAKEQIELRELVGGALILAATLVPQGRPEPQAIERAAAVTP